jgi:predicted metal-binding membrane protein
MNTASAEARPGNIGQDATFFAAAALVFGITAAATLHGCLSMSMPGMRMPGQTWPGVVAQFLSMWVAMMVAMMLPSLVPTLWRYRRALRRAGATRLGWLTTLVSVGYFAVWALLGVAAVPLSIALTAVPTGLPVVGVLLLIAGLLQFSAWKAHHLACCRTAAEHGRRLPSNPAAAWRYGLRWGLHCSYCCAGPTAVLLAFGVMNLRAMTLVMLAITAERLAPAGDRVARTIGAGAVVAGLLLLARA